MLCYVYELLKDLNEFLIELENVIKLVKVSHSNR